MGRMQAIHGSKAGHGARGTHAELKLPRKQSDRLSPVVSVSLMGWFGPLQFFQKEGRREV
jgi:hypothetical protein